VLLGTFNAYLVLTVLLLARYIQYLPCPNWVARYIHSLPCPNSIARYINYLG